MTWKTIDIKSSGYRKLQKIVNYNKSVYAIVSDDGTSSSKGAICLVKNNTLEKQVDVNAPYGRFDLHVLKDNNNTALKMLFLGDGIVSTVSLTENKYTNQKINLGARNARVSNGTKVYSFGDRVNGIIADFGVEFPKSQRLDFQYGSYKDSFYEGAVLKDKYLYFLDREGAKRYYSETSDSSKVRYAVWRFNTETKEKVDISGNLEALSILGNPYGEIRDLISNPEKTKLWVSTQEGIFETDISDDNVTTASNWTHILCSSGNTRIEYTGGKLICLGRNSITGIRLGIYQGEPGKWVYTERLKTDNKPIDDIVCVDNIIYCRERLGSIHYYDISNLNYKDYSNVKVAKYLNLADIDAICQDTDKLYIASDSKLYTVDTNGYKVVIGELQDEVFSIKVYKNIIYLVTNTGIKVIKDSKVLNIPSEVAFTLKNNIKLEVSDTYIAVLNGKNLSVYSTDTYDLLASRDIPGSYITDIAVTEDYVYVTGFNNRGMSGIPVQVPILREYGVNLQDRTLVQTRTLWNYNSEELSSNMADTRAYYIQAVNGKLIIQFETAGGNTILRWNGKDLSTDKQIIIDRYSHPYNAASAHLCYFCLVDIDTWQVEKGQFIFPRQRRGGKTNTCRAKGIYSPDGNSIYLAMSAASYIEQRELMRFAGQPVKDYAGDAAFALVEDEWDTRKFWLTPGKGEPVFISDIFSIVRTNDKELPVTEKTDNSEFSTNYYLIVW